MTGLKKISIKMVVKDSFDNDIVKKHPAIISITEFEDTPIKHTDLLSNYSFEFLKNSGIQFVTGTWNAIKGFIGMASWSLIIIVESFKWLWKEAFGK
jgi:hypothetical protein